MLSSADEGRTRAGGGGSGRVRAASAPYAPHTKVDVAAGIMPPQLLYTGPMPPMYGGGGGGGGGTDTALYAFTYPGTYPIGAYPMVWAGRRNFKRSWDDLRRTAMRPHARHQRVRPLQSDTDYGL